MVISIPKTKAAVFNTAFPGPLQWTCGGQQLEVVSEFKYLGLVFHAQHGLSAIFPNRKQKTYAAWALLKRQYGRLECLSSVGLLFRVACPIVPSVASYGCEVWGAYQFPLQSDDQRKE